MSGTGALNYIWNGPQPVINALPFAATATGNYTLTGTDVNGCTNSATALLTVHNLPSVSIGTLTPNDSVCSGTMVFLAGAGALSYSWTGPQPITNATPFAAINSGTYTVTGSNAFQCTGTATQTITVHALPVVTVSAVNPNDTVCDGELLTLAGGGAVTYLWSGPQVISDNIPFAAGTSGVYTVTGTDGNLCTNTSSVAVTVNPIPVFSLGSDTSICQGTSFTLMQPYNGATVLWNDNSAADTLAVNQSGAYWCSVTQSGCSYTDSIQIGLDSLPLAHFGFLIANSQLTLSDSSKFANDYKWFFGDGDSSDIAAPIHNYAANGNYTVTMIVSNGCGSDTTTADISVITAIHEQVVQQLLIYPNPATSQLFIDLKDHDRENVSLYLIDLKGDVLLKDNYIHAEKLIKLDVTSLSAGTYLLRIVVGEKVYVNRLSIVK